MNFVLNHQLLLILQLWLNSLIVQELICDTVHKNNILFLHLAVLTELLTFHVLLKFVIIFVLCTFHSPNPVVCTLLVLCSIHSTLTPRCYLYSTCSVSIVGIKSHTSPDSGGLISFKLKNREVIVTMSHVSVEPDLVSGYCTLGVLISIRPGYLV